MIDKKIHPARRVVGGLILLMGILIFVQSYLGFVTNQMTAILQAEAQETGSMVSVDFISALVASFQYVAGIATFLVALLFTVGGLMVLISGQTSKKCFIAAFITAVGAVIGIINS